MTTLAPDVPVVTPDRPQPDHPREECEAHPARPRNRFVRRLRAMRDAYFGTAENRATATNEIREWGW